MEKRYSSPLRQQQQEMTRRRIMEAMLGLIVEGRIHDFTIRDVATRAGVSYGSVYKHYATREALLSGLHTWAEHLPNMPALPQSLHELPQWVKSQVAGFEANGESAVAFRRAMTILNIRSEGHERRDAFFRTLVETSLPGLGEAEARQGAAVLRYITSSASWQAMRQEQGLSAEETGKALSWAAEVLIRDLKERATKGDSI